jgi:cytochrome c peroxidase
MKSINVLSLLTAIIILVAVSCKQDEEKTSTAKLVLLEPKLPATPFDYAASDAPKEIVGFQTIENDKATLGRVLFYDKMLSINHTLACASCHVQQLGFADGKTISRGFTFQSTSRNSMTIVNLGRQSAFFWDERENNLQKMSIKPIQNHVEMGFDSLQKVLNNIKNTPYYKSLFQKAFQSENAITEENLAQALTQFLLSIQSYQSKYDFGRAINFVNFTSEELEGKQLFTEKLHCNRCHTEPAFKNEWMQGANIGLDLVYKDNGIGEWLKQNPSDGFTTPDSKEGAFKIPSLRNVEVTAPYMHDGRFKTLEEVVEHYNSGVKNHPNLDWNLRFRSNPNGSGFIQTTTLNLSELEKRALVAFLKTLTDYRLLNDAKFSDPFKPVE